MNLRIFLLSFFITNCASGNEYIFSEQNIRYNVTKNILNLKINNETFILRRMNVIKRSKTYSNRNIVATITSNSLALNIDGTDLRLNSDKYVPVPFEPFKCKYIEINHANAGTSTASAPTTTVPVKFAPRCYRNDKRRHTFKIMIVTDLSFFYKIGNVADIRSEVELMVSVASKLLMKQINVRLVIARLDITVPGNNKTGILNYNENTCPSLEVLLIRFNNYTTSFPTRNSFSHIHLLTGCGKNNKYSGIAYTNSLCSDFNVGLTKFKLSMYRTFIHEFGHGIGLLHTSMTCSIMDQTPCKYNYTGGFDISQRTELCNFLKNAQSKCLRK